MNVWLIRCLALVGLSAGSAGWSLAQELPPCKLEIVPTTYAGVVSPDAAIELAGKGRFYVLLTNTSTSPLVFFEEWNSWGYYNLTFEVTYPDGRKVGVGKIPRGWDKNAPTTFTVAPGGYHVFEVDFGSEWGSFIRRDKASSQPYVSCRMRAIYTNTERGQRPFEEHVWQGTIASTEKSYTIWPR